MSHQLEILKKYAKNELWFLKGKYPISYKLVILHSFYNTIKTEEWTKENFKEKVQQTWDYINRLPSNSFNCNCYSIFKFYDHDEVAGIFLVDHSHNCFPLVFYDQKYKSDYGKKLRVSALQKCIFDIQNHYSTLFDLMENSVQWSQELQDAILKEIPEDTKDQDNF